MEHPDTKAALAYQRGLVRHLQTCFPASQMGVIAPPFAKIQSTLPGFAILECAPGASDKTWLYVTAGAGQVPDRRGIRLEFALITEARHELHSELLTLLAYYHSRPQGRLSLGDTVPIEDP